MFKIIKTFVVIVWQNPKEGFRILWLIFGTMFIFIFGCIGLGVTECGKIVLDKIKTKG